MDGLHERARGEALGVMMAPDVPVKRGHELARAVAGEALRAVITERVGQIVKHGYSAEADAALPLRQLPAHARSMIVRGMDQLSGGNLAAARRTLAKSAAVLMAAIDRIDVEIAKGGE